MNIYDFSVKQVDGGQKSLADYKNKVLLIVNTAPHCGLAPQYDELEKLYKKYKKDGFEILDLPSNQFANQAPESNEQIVNFCQTNYSVSFQIFSKIEVNGKNADPLYKYLKKQKPGALSGYIKWNFTKFLIDKSGNVFKRYAPVTNPTAIEKDIKRLLGL